MPAEAPVRQIDSREYTHERLGAQFLDHLSHYDTQRRVEILIDDFLPDEAVRGKRALDVGCGLGFFSARLSERGAQVTAIDLGPTLVEQTRARVGCEALVADALDLVGRFGPAAFDTVVSSECIEHTPAPTKALQQMALLLKPGGWLSISTPNLIWSPVVKLASRIRLRPYAGFENFSTWAGLRRTMRAADIEIVREYGLHAFPFQFRMHDLARWLDDHGQWARSCMINICILGRKRRA